MLPVNKEIMHYLFQKMTAGSVVYFLTINHVKFLTSLERGTNPMIGYARKFEYSYEATAERPLLWHRRRKCLPASGQP